MSVLIRGMKMPRSCDECPCYYETEGAWRNECEVLGKEYTASENRPEWCPLVELPPHGRLIDALEINEVKWVHPDTAWQRGWNSAIDAILENAQTIIEAEVSE